MNTLAILRYIAIPITVVATNLVVYTILPGNIILAMVLCSTFVLLLIPSDNTEKNGKEMEEKKIAFDDISHPLDFSDMTMEEKSLHKTMGNVFNAMAHGAGRDIYSSELTGTEEMVEKENKSDNSFFSGHKSYDNSEINYSTTPSQDIPKVRLEVSQDGKLHYIFLEEETDVEEVEKSPENLPDIAQDDADFETADDLIDILESRLAESDAKKKDKFEKKLQLTE